MGWEVHMTRVVIAFGVALAHLFTPVDAAAQEPSAADNYESGWPEVPEEEPEPAHGSPRERRWYGWQTLATDGASVLLLVLAAGYDPRTSSGRTARDYMLGTGLVGYYLGAPIVHFSHGHVGKGFGSFGIRAGGTALFVWGLSQCYNGSGCDAGAGPLLLGVATTIAAIPIDAAALAWEDVPRDELTLRVAPHLHPDRRGGGVVLTGRF
jgi:hypothetical protein